MEKGKCLKCSEIRWLGDSKYCSSCYLRIGIDIRYAQGEIQKRHLYDLSLIEQDRNDYIQRRLNKEQLEIESDLILWLEKISGVKNDG